MRKNSDNYFILAFGISYLIIACIQICLDGLLPAWMFFSIAFVSINLNIYGILKNLLIYFQDVQNKKYEEIIQITNSESVYSGKKEDLIHQKGGNKKEQRDKLFRAINLFLNIFVIISTVIIILLSSIKKIPYDYKTNKIICVATLISFSLSFFSVFITNRITSKTE